MAHLKFVSIHPFTDGNGRTARLLMNAIIRIFVGLKKTTYELISIVKQST